LQNERGDLASFVYRLDACPKQDFRQSKLEFKSKAEISETEATFLDMNPERVNS